MTPLDILHKALSDVEALKAFIKPLVLLTFLLAPPWAQGFYKDLL